MKTDKNELKKGKKRTDERAEGNKRKTDIGVRANEEWKKRRKN